MNEKTGVFVKYPKAPVRKIGTKVKETKVIIIVTTTERVNMFEMGTTTVKTTSMGITIVTGMIGVGPMFLAKIVKLLLGMVEVVLRELKRCCRI